jgi:hypothetical protein
MQALLLVAEQNRPTMFARIGVMQALWHVERVFRTDRKETQWGRRKLARVNSKAIFLGLTASRRVLIAELLSSRKPNAIGECALEIKC